MLAQKLGHVNRMPLATILNLMPATGSICHDQSLCLLPNGWQQAQFSHLHRNLMVRGFIAKAASHAAATRLNQLGLSPWQQANDMAHGRHHAKGFLMAVPVQQDVLIARVELGFQSFELACLILLCQKFFK